MCGHTKTCNEFCFLSPKSLSVCFSIFCQWNIVVILLPTKRECSKHLAETFSRTWSEIAPHFWWPFTAQKKNMEDLMYFVLHLKQLRLYKCNHPWEYLMLQLRVWHALPPQVIQSLTKQRWSRTAQNAPLQWVQVSWRYGWAVEGSWLGMRSLIVGLQCPPSVCWAPRLPHICVLSDTVAGSCSLSL